MQTAPAQAVRRARFPSLRRLRGSLAQIAAMGGSIALFTLVLIAIAYLGYLAKPLRTDIREAAVEDLLALEQIVRAQSLPTPDVAFFGDSSCLMGIHVPTLRARLPDLSSENFCTTARAGPAGYAYALDEMISRRSIPSAVVIALHPIQFRRQKSWDGLLAFIRANGIVGYDQRGMLAKALDYVRIEWLGPVLYSPLPGIYGSHYGSEKMLFNELRTNGGSLVDPTRGFVLTPGIEQSYARNEEFEAALEPLRRAIARLPHQNVFLMIMPIPAQRWTTRTETERRQAAEAIADRAGIEPANILATEGSWPDEHFAVPNHLSVHGRILFSDRIAPLIAQLAQRQSAGTRREAMERITRKPR